MRFVISLRGYRGIYIKNQMGMTKKKGEGKKELERRKSVMKREIKRQKKGKNVKGVRW